jgi:hypothetical protein
MSDLPLRKSIIATALAMNALGINRGKSGNVSARWKDGFLITPSGLPTRKPGRPTLSSSTGRASQRANGLRLLSGASITKSTAPARMRTPWFTPIRVSPPRLPVSGWMCLRFTT